MESSSMYDYQPFIYPDLNDTQILMGLACAILLETPQDLMQPILLEDEGASFLVQFLESKDRQAHRILMCFSLEKSTHN